MPARGPAAAILHQLAGGLRAAMGYVGAANVAEFQAKAKFARISSAALRVKPSSTTSRSPARARTIPPAVEGSQARRARTGRGAGAAASRGGQLSSTQFSNLSAAPPGKRRDTTPRRLSRRTRSSISSAASVNKAAPPRETSVSQHLVLSGHRAYRAQTLRVAHSRPSSRRSWPLRPGRNRGSRRSAPAPARPCAG